MVVLPISVVLLSVVSEIVNPTTLTPVKSTIVPGAKVTFAVKCTGAVMLSVLWMVTGTLMVKLPDKGNDGSKSIVT